MTYGNSDRRLLAALRMVDAVTGTTVLDLLEVTAAEFRTVRNHSGLYLLLDGPGLLTYSSTFDLSGFTVPASSVVSVVVRDLAGQYLPRRVSVTIPRSTAVASSDAASIFQPQDVQLYPSPAATIRDTWALLYVSVSSTGASTGPLPWTLLQAQDPATSKVLATTISDARGEALLAVPVPKVSAGTTEVIATNKAVNVLAASDPAARKAGAAYIPDPDALITPPAAAILNKSTTPANAQAGVATAVAVQIAL